MQLDVNGGEVRGLRRSCVMCGRNMLKKAHAQPYVNGLPHQKQRETAIGKWMFAKSKRKACRNK